jgi:hypothetical protein
VEKSVNKFLAYSVIAILLGSVMMVVPLAVLGPENLVPTDSNHDVLWTGEENAERNDCPPDAQSLTTKSNGTDTYDSLSERGGHETELALDTASGLSSMGLMVVPGFLVALGVFVYLKKWTV